MVDSRIYAALERFTSVVALNLLWLLASLPLLTVFPATAAMFGVVREWSRGNEPRLLPTFTRLFRENVKQALALQAVVSGIGLGLLADVYLARGLSPTVHALSQAVVLLVAGVLATALAYAFPLLVTYRMPFGRLLRTSLLLVIGRPATTVRCLAIGVLAVLLTLAFPAAPLLFGSLVASATYRWCARVFDEVSA
ncbi:YesL family protein [Flindersiella endophytica]